MEKHDSFDVSYVELTDMGLLYDRRQLDSAIRLATPTDEAGVDVIVYVHGWKHSAEYDDSDTSNFSRFVMPFMTPIGSKRRTVGIYVAWRGSPIDMPVVNNLTFYDRKGAADHIARGSIRELLSRLRAVREAATERVSVTVVGHSFGGLILFNAISGSLMDAVVQTEFSGFTKGAKRPTLFDLAILLNPAFEGVRYEPLFQGAIYGRDKTSKPISWPADSAPFLISITSASDGATGALFPLGRIANSIFQSEELTDQDPDQVKLGDWVEKVGNRNALGHIARYRTHNLMWSKDTGVVTCGAVKNPLLPNPDAFPLWSIYTDTPFIKNHNDIFDEHMWRYVSMLRHDVIRDGRSSCPSGNVGTK